MSFVDRSRAGASVWQQVGTAASVTPLRNLYFFGQFDYNLLKSTYQGMRYRLTYHPRSWSISAEINNQKPRIYEDSFFNVFELSAFNQVRGAVSYYLGRQYQLNLQYMHSRFEAGETANEAILTVGRTRWGDVGLIVQTGFGGEHVGLFGNLNYSILDNLQFRLRSTYNSFTARTLSIGEEATAFALGFHYRPISSLLLQTEVQRINNTFFDRDVRALLRINYLFGRRRDPAVRTFL